MVHPAPLRRDNTNWKLVQPFNILATFGIVQNVNSFTGYECSRSSRSVHGFPQSTLNAQCLLRFTDGGYHLCISAPVTWRYYPIPTIGLASSATDFFQTPPMKYHNIVYLKTVTHI